MTNKASNLIITSTFTPRPRLNNVPGQYIPRISTLCADICIELLEAGVITESTSPFASPIVVVRKKNGDIRLSIDYRKLNLQTIKDAYPLPNLEESFTALTGAKWFSVLDLKSGDYQIEMNEPDKQKSASIKYWPIPKNLKQLQSFLGFAGYNWGLFKDLYRHCKTPKQSYPWVRSSPKVKGQESYTIQATPQSKPALWLAFDTLIVKKSSAPVLGFADPALPYILHTDASASGLGDALYQEQDGKLSHCMGQSWSITEWEQIFSTQTGIFST